VTVDLGYQGSGAVQYTGSSTGSDTLNSIEKVIGSAYGDYLYGSFDENRMTGGSGSDYIYGFDGNDTILGESGIDTIYGGSGTDRIDGGNSSDQLYGGDGADYFGFVVNDTTVTGTDTINDFEKGWDYIDLSQANNDLSFSAFDTSGDGVISGHDVYCLLDYKLINGAYNYVLTLDGGAAAGVGSGIQMLQLAGVRELQSYEVVG
jgi:Ca2+-binding RTX toxin-like protein